MRRNVNSNVVIFFILVFINVTLYSIWWGALFPKIKQTEQQLSLLSLEHATISYSDVEQFIGTYIGNYENKIKVIVPPFSCTKCVKQSIDELKQIVGKVDIYIPSYFENSFYNSDELNVNKYYIKETDSPIAYYSNILIVICNGNKVSDFYLVDKCNLNGIKVFLSAHYL